MKRFVLTILLLFGVLCIGSSTVGAKEKTIGAFRYHYTSLTKNTCQITQVDVLKKKQASVLKFPDTLGGKKVVKIGRKDDDWEGIGTNVFGIYPSCENGDYILSEETIKSKWVKKVILPETLQEITYHCFSYLPSLKKIIISSNVKKGVTYLCDTKWTSFQISEKNPYYKVKNGLLLSKNGKTVYGVVSKNKKIKIPEGVEKVREYAFAQININSVYISSSVKKIETGAFTTSRFVKLNLSKKNKFLEKKKNCLILKKTGKLIAYIHKGGKVSLPKEVKRLEYGISLIGEKIYQLEFPKTLTYLGRHWHQDFYEYGDPEWGKCGEITFQGTKPPKVEKGEGWGYRIYVPSKAYRAYVDAVEKSKDGKINPVDIIPID